MGWTNLMSNLDTIRDNARIVIMVGTVVMDMVERLFFCLYLTILNNTRFLWAL